MDRIVNVGIIGLGGISPSHTVNYENDPRTKITAVCDTDEPWLALEKERLGADHAYADYHDLLKNPDVDAVVICLPTWLHAQASIDALNAGKHVLCEKPMACSSAEARAMKAAAERAGKKLMVSHQQRFGQDIQLLRKLNQENFFGEIYFMRLGWRRPMGIMPTPDEKRPNGMPYNRNWFNEKDKGGGVLRDLGSHLLDLALYITDFPALDSAHASTYRKFHPELSVAELEKHVFDSEDLAAAHIKFVGGLSFELEVSFGSMIDEEVLLTEIYGTKAGASRRFSCGVGGVKLFRADESAISTETIKKINMPTIHPDTLFIDSILNDTECPMPPEQGVQVIDILDAIYASARA